MTIDELRAYHNKQPIKKKASFEEYNIQAEFFSKIRLVYPQLEKLIFHISNEGVRNRRYVKRSGITKGVADVFLSVPNTQYYGFYIEFKTSKGKQSEGQEIFQREAENAGYKYKTFTSAADAFLEVREYLKTTNYAK